MDVDPLHAADTDELIFAAAKCCSELRGGIFAFDDGAWIENKILWESVQQSPLDEVILDPTVKKGLTDDIVGFFDRKVCTRTSPSRESAA